MNYKIVKISHIPPEFTDLISESSEEGFRFIKKTKEQWDSGKNTFNKPGESFYLAYDHQKLVGCCGINIDPYTDDESMGRIRHLYVSQNYRRKGIAKTLTLKCLEDAKSYFKIVRLRANQTTVDSYKFYESLGFEKSNLSSEETHRIKLKN